MSRMLLTLLAVSAAVACSAAARPETSHAAPAALSETLAPAAPVTAPPAAEPAAAPAHYAEENGMRCDIRARRTSHGVELEGFVHADRPISGSYRLVVSSGGANSSDIEQSGDFDAAPGEAVSLGVAELSGRNIHARLTVDADGGSCTDEYHS